MNRISRAFVCTALCALLSLPVSAARAEELGSYGINIAFTPSSRTTRYRFEVFDPQLSSDQPLASRELQAQPDQSSVFLPFLYDPAREHDYTLRVTAYPLPGREGLDAPASRTSAFTTGKTGVCGHTPAAGGFLAGDGSAAAPYLVATPAQFDHIKSHLTAHFIQCSDFDFDGKALASPSGTFSGVYDGNYHVVRNAKTSPSWMMEISGTVKNLGLENFTVSALNGYSSGVITRHLTKGGLIENCYVSGCTVDSSLAAGLVGVLQAGATVRNCYSLGCTFRAPTPDHSAGGIVGSCHGGTISYCWSVPAALSSPIQPGGIVGDEAFSGTVTDCYFLSNSAWNNGKGTALSDAQLKAASTYQNWDTSVWEIADGSYPALKGF